ncbi:MAG: hypothetical protein Q8O76_05620, partial [Chloroflexota bacterium]|nr:hypothetical protein [Chloroflexota bacterium]
QVTPVPTATPSRGITPTPTPTLAPGTLPPGTVVRPVSRELVPPVIPTAVVVIVVGLASYVAIRLGKFSRESLAFLAVMAGVALLGLFLLWSNAAAAADRLRLNDQLRDARVRIERTEADTNLEATRQALQETSSLFPTMGEAEEVAHRLYSYAEQGGLKVTNFEFRHVPAQPKTKSAPAIAGIFEAEGEQGSISAFLEGLSEVAPTVAVQEVRVTVVGGGKAQARLRVAVYYREK